MSRVARQPAERIVNAPVKRRRGRPPKPIDERQVIELAEIGCTYREVAAVMNTTPSVIKDRFSEHMERGADLGRMSLRRLQFKSARNGNVAMQIWLGKNYLGQTDKQEYIEKQIDYSKLTDDELETLAAAESIY